MQQTRGREKAKKNIVIFVIGVFIGLVATVMTTIGSLTSNTWLALFGILGIVGIVLEIIAIICLRNVNKHYANALWCLILDLLVNLVSIIISVIVALQTEVNPVLVSTTNWLTIISDVASACVVIYFVLGTNELAKENGKGMPVLTKAIVIGYMAMFVLSLVFNLLSLIPSFVANETAVLVFSIIILVLYVIREICYILFLIRALWRVE